MNDLEWLAYLDTLPPELRDLANNIAERINTLLNRERGRAIDERQELHQRSDTQGAKINDLRAIVADVVARVAALEQPYTAKAVNDASDSVRPPKP